MDEKVEELTTCSRSCFKFETSGTLDRERETIQTTGFLAVGVSELEQATSMR